MMYNNIKCTSAPIEFKESKDSGIIKELDNMVPNHPREIIEFNKSLIILLLKFLSHN